MGKIDMKLRLLQVLQNADALIALYDDEDRLQYANKRFQEAWFIGDGETPLWSEIMVRNFELKRGTVLATTDIEAWLQTTKARRGKSRSRAFETDLHDGRWIWMAETTDADGWMLCVGTDITSVRSDQRSLRQARDVAIRASHTDELTGTTSRRFAMSQFEAMLNSEPNIGRHAGCVAVIDIDNFKYINDRFGHAVGDAVLKDFASTLQKFVRKTDTFGRIGGEEFLLVLPSASLEKGQLILEKMLAAVRVSKPIPSDLSSGTHFPLDWQRLALVKISAKSTSRPT